MWKSVGLSQENWNASSSEGRLASLRVLEMQIAESEGRTVRNIETYKGNDSDSGTFKRDEPDKISINEKLLDQNNPREAVRTVAHEGRHAYQFDCITQPEKHPEVSPETKATWAHNFENYKSPDKHGHEEYRSQPLEADARQFENKVIDQLYTSKETGLQIDKARPQDVAQKGGNEGLLAKDPYPLDKASQNAELKEARPKSDASPDNKSLSDLKAEAKASLESDRPSSAPSKPAESNKFTEAQSSASAPPKSPSQGAAEKPQSDPKQFIEKTLEEIKAEAKASLDGDRPPPPPPPPPPSQGKGFGM